jgi:hypothetical protein
MTMLYPNGSSPDGYWSFNNGETYPLPDYSADSTPSLILGDQTLYTVANFFRNITNSNLQPRFSEDMSNAGIKNANIPTYVDNTAVAQVVTYPLYPNILTTSQFKFPLMSVSQTGMQSVMFTSVKTSVKRDFAVTWVLPPMTAPQLNVLQAHLSIAAKSWMAYGSIGYDPKLSTTSAWNQAGIAFGELGKVSMMPFKGNKPVENGWQEVMFPAITLNLSLWEVNQLGLPINYPIILGDIGIQLNVADGYNINNPLNNFIDGYVYPNLTLTSISPNSGSIQGDTLCFITGQGFNAANTYTVSVNGAVGKSVLVRSPVMLQFITNQSINAATGTGNLVVSDNLGNTATLTNGWTYTSP